MAEVQANRGSKFLIILIAVLALGTVYLLFDPAETSWMPKCPVHTLTGLDCPGCGSQRALHALLHGDLNGVVNANAILLLFLPLIATLGLGELNRKRWPRFYNFIISTTFIYSILGALIGWTIFRNIIY